MTHKTCPTWGVTQCGKTLFGVKEYRTSYRWEMVDCPDCLADRMPRAGQRYGRVLVNKAGVDRVDARTVVRVEAGVYYRMRRVVRFATMEQWKAWARTARLSELARARVCPTCHGSGKVEMPRVHRRARAAEDDKAGLGDASVAELIGGNS